MAQDRSRESVTDAPAPANRVAAVRAVVYDAEGELIAPNALTDALQEAGVTVTETDDGVPQYEDVPPALSLSACHLAVDLREDPETFLSAAPGE